MTFGHDGGHAFNEDQRGGHDPNPMDVKDALRDPAGFINGFTETVINPRHTNARDPSSMIATAAEVLDLVKAHAGYIDSLLGGPEPMYTRTCWTPHLLLLVRDSNGQAPDSHHLMYIDLPWTSDEEKRGAMLNIGRRLYRERVFPAAAALSSEAWMALDCEKGQRPADHPDRREVLVITAASNGGSNAVMQWMNADRGQDDKLLIGPWDPPVTEGVTPVLLNQLWAGFFADILEKFRTTPGSK